MRKVSLLQAGAYLPEQIVDISFFQEGGKEEDISKMFRGVKTRRVASPEETPYVMMKNAAKKIIEANGIEWLKKIDLVLTNVSLPNEVFYGCGAILSQEMNIQPKYVFDFHQSGCVSFITMLDVAKSYIENGIANHALIFNVCNVGALCCKPSIRIKPHARIPGDGCGVAYVAASDKNPILSTVQFCHPEYARGMHMSIEEGKMFWEPTTKQRFIEFDPNKVVQVLRVGNKVVPEAMKAACQKANVTFKDIKWLLTNQPSELFLRNWREAIELPEERLIHSFSSLGNMFGAAIPVNLTSAIAEHKFQKGDTILLAGFSHAGDFSAAAVIKWNEY